MQRFAQRATSSYYEKKEKKSSVRSTPPTHRQPPSSLTRSMKGVILVERQAAENVEDVVLRRRHRKLA
jgi:hypothetical protein